MRKAIGLFGGTFDPVHNGHLAIAESFLASDYISELWILLTPFPPHKESETQSDYQLRYQMLTMMFDGLKKVTISTIENDLPKPSYTLQTLHHLKKSHSENDFYLCIGEDSLMNFHKWKSYQEILKLVELLVAKRPNFDHSEVDQGILDKTTFVDHKPVDISSSEIRIKIQNHKTVKDLIPKSLETFISKHGLYR